MKESKIIGKLIYRQALMDVVELIDKAKPKYKKEVQVYNKLLDKITALMRDADSIVDDYLDGYIIEASQFA